MRVLILAAGSGERWGDYTGVPKQLAEVLGEPLLHRTTRLLRERGCRDVSIVTRDPG